MSKSYALLSSLLLLCSLEAKKTASHEDVLCEKTPNHERLELKHIESKGIGYSQGYTSLEGFFPLYSPEEHNWMPFFDVRAHIFDDGKPAANAGFGFRYLNSRIWGAGLYYDYRKTSHFHYNQVGLGLESLGKMWDYRLNAYFPTGSKVSDPYRYKFHAFEGNRMILSNRREFALTGANFEVGAHAISNRKFDLYTALGPYYLSGEGQSAWGGEGRIALTAWDAIRLQFSGSYDNLFKGIMQGEISFMYSWGGKKTKEPKSECRRPNIILKRAVQRATRHEIIATHHKHEHRTARHPVTRAPLQFWFVDNTSHSQGTFESPFNTLSAAEAASWPNDILYVFTGDGTDTGLDSGLTLQAGQQLLGAGIEQQIATTKGRIIVPPQGTGMPQITNRNDPTGLGVQLVAGNNIVSGIHFHDVQGAFISPIYSAALSIMSGTDYSIHNNWFFTSSVGSCVNIYGDGDNTTITNNTMISTDGFNQTDGVFFFDPLKPINGTFNIIHNVFKGDDNVSGFNNSIGTFGAGSPLQLTSNVIWNVIDNMLVSGSNTAATSGGIIFTAGNGTVNIIGNYLNIPPTFTSPLAGVYIEKDFSTGVVTANLENNIVISTPPTPGYKFVNNSGNPDELKINFAPSNIGKTQGP